MTALPLTARGRERFTGLLLAAVHLAMIAPLAQAQEADLIVHGGHIITVDAAFTIPTAMAVRQGRVLQVGEDAEMLRYRGPQSEVIDLEGKWVLPGLIDSHTHPVGASMIEFDHEIPAMETIEDVLAYIRSRAQTVPKGEWIVVRQVFITRLEEQRYPTRSELDVAAPDHAVLFATGPDASLNSLALSRSGIDRDFQVSDGGSGFAEKDPATGEPTGILRNCTRYVKLSSDSSEPAPTREQKLQRLSELFSAYHAVGLTSVGDRNASVEDLELYRELRRRDRLTVRVHLSQSIPSIGSLESVLGSIRQVAEDPLFRERDERLRLVGIKTFLDGGMLTGSAYMRAPWGTSDIYAIRDPEYRGVRFIPHERLVPMIRTAVECGLQFTAHAVGDGAVHGLLDAYEEVARKQSFGTTRPCISHSNFMSREAIEQAAQLGVAVDLQPAWLHLDTRTLARQFGYDRLRYFQPLSSLFKAGVIAGGGSDHMQKVGARRSINPYDPFLGMATTVTRRAKGYDRALHPEEALTREEMIRFYTINNAHLLRRDDQLGSLERGKLADFIIVDTDLLSCAPEAIERTKVLGTYVDGRRVWPSTDSDSEEARP